MRFWGTKGEGTGFSLWFRMSHPPLEGEVGQALSLTTAATLNVDVLPPGCLYPRSIPSVWSLHQVIPTMGQLLQFTVLPGVDVPPTHP